LPLSVPPDRAQVSTSTSLDLVLVVERLPPAAMNAA
jgi:hypothetical protein